MSDFVEIQFRVAERHEIEVKMSDIPGMAPVMRDGKSSWGRYFFRWRRSVKGTGFDAERTNVDTITLIAYAETPPEPTIRYWTYSRHNIGLHRIVQDGEKWFIELLEEVVKEVTEVRI